MSQNEKVLSRLKRGPLTSMQAFKELNITRLSARIWDLRRLGFDIRAEICGNNCGHPAKYRLIIQ